jgi:hypothetical protein
MPSKSPNLTFTAVNKKREEIEKMQTIPAADVTLLGERLVIACTPETPQRRLKHHLESREYTLKSRQKKARRLYLEVLEKDAYLFLPFILTVSPSFCARFGTTQFLQQHKKRKITFSNDAYLLLWHIATRHGIEKTIVFKKLIQSIFESRPPVTGAEAEGNENCSLTMCDLSAIRIAFGHTICDAIESSSTHLSKKLDGQFSQTTQCIQTNVPYDGYQDTIIRLDVGSALELADLLFPSASQKIASVLSMSTRLIPQTSGSEVSLDPNNLQNSFSEFGTKDRIKLPTCSANYPGADFAYFTMRGASVSAMRSVFGADICEGIENSELRHWEREQLLIDTTDCITMQICRSQPQDGNIRLRIGYFAGLNLANQLYADPAQLPCPDPQQSSSDNSCLPTEC